MNPDRIWRELANDALAKQVTAAEYGLFVAMPFKDHFSYRADLVFQNVVCAGVDAASAIVTSRRFARPVRADKMVPNGGEITDDIVEGILESHFFLADLSFANHGVLVELGVALALKSPRYVVLIAQGDLKDLHFDIKDNRVISYDRADAIDSIAAALVGGAERFEASVGQRMEHIRRSLSVQAVHLLQLYGVRRKINRGFSLFANVVNDDENLSPDPVHRRLIFNSAAQELQARGLLELDYHVAEAGEAGDRFGFHATKLGLVFIKQTWPSQFADLD